MQTKKDNRNAMRRKKERRKMCAENKNENIKKISLRQLF